MNADFSPELQKELLDDFYAECDELLARLRDALMLLESGAGPTDAPPATLEALYRNLHSFKGISAIAGLRAAEQLSHAAEDFVRAVSRREQPLTDAGLELLMNLVQALEQMVGAHRHHQPLPDSASLLERFAAFTAKGAAQASATAAQPSSFGIAPAPPGVAIEAARARGLIPWECTFVPSADLDRRGVNLASVRARLGRLGEILSANPVVRPGGAILFEFVVGVREAPADLPAWEADGISLHPREAAAPGFAEAAPTVAEAERSTGLFIAPSHIVRVDLSRLDELMHITGELFVRRVQLEERLNRDAPGSSDLRDVNLAFARSLRDLRGAIVRVRLVPIAEIFSRMPFVIRDLAHESGKKVRLTLEGQRTEIDKYLVEQLKEPLLHLVRNAFSHGAESVEERLAANKPAETTILLRATAAGDAVVIQVRDDGRGIDGAAVAARAQELGLPVPANLDPVALLDLLCTPGFSTREEADRAAGRGVGMAVVRNSVRELGGTLALDTSPGRGTEFTLRLPLTLSIAEMFILSVGSQLCAVPQNCVHEILQVSSAQIRTITQTEVVPYRDGLLPLLRLRAIFGCEPEAPLQITVLAVSTERGTTGLVVDRVLGQREVVVRPLRDPLIRVPGISGATELGDGKPVLILDPTALTQGVTRPPEKAAPKKI